MTQETFDLLIADPDKLKEAAIKEKPTQSNAYIKQYNTSGHDVMDTSIRPDKTVVNDRGTTLVKVTRLGIPLQKKIVFYAAAFLCANPVKLNASTKDQQQENLLAVIDRTWDENKLDYKNMELAEILMSETEVAEVWYTEDLPADSGYWSETVNEKIKFRLRMKVLAKSLGDELLPVYNEFGDMIAFIRTYKIQNGDDQVERMEIYTADTIQHLEKQTSGWSELKSATNVIKKIPVIYYRQAQPEWEEVQTLIDRFELSLSKHSDTNDYFGSPMVKVKGSIKGFASKGEEGKVIELENGAEAEYLTWDQSPESTKLEQTNLRSLIFDMTDTPDISFTQMSKLGTFSGFAIKLLFMSAHLKAAKKEQVFGEGVQRRINYIKAAMGKLNTSLEKATTLNIKPHFEYYLPKDIENEVDVLVRALEGGILSQETAIEKNPLVADPKEEKDRIKAEKEATDSNPDKLDDELDDPEA